MEYLSTAVTELMTHPASLSVFMGVVSVWLLCGLSIPLPWGEIKLNRPNKERFHWGKANIHHADMDMLCDFYDEWLGEFYSSNIATHLFSNTKEFLERCLDVNSIPYDDKEEMAKYVGFTAKYINEHLLRKIMTKQMIPGLTQTFDAARREELETIVKKILIRNRVR